MQHISELNAVKLYPVEVLITTNNSYNVWLLTVPATEMLSKVQDHTATKQ